MRCVWGHHTLPFSADGNFNINVTSDHFHRLFTLGYYSHILVSSGHTYSFNQLRTPRLPPHPGGKERNERGICEATRAGYNCLL